MKLKLLIAAVLAVLLTGFLWQGSKDSRTVVSDSGSVSTATHTDVTEPQWAGTESCLECHDNQHRSWLQSVHSRAMSAAMSGPEPADGDYLHVASGRRYQSRQKNGELWHAEALVDTVTQTAPPTVDVQLKYLVGSGRHSRTYLAELDGFLTESPLTWYSSTGSWSMSPGYDHAEHLGFERPVDTGCLICHCGRIESVDGAFHRLRIAETSIGCERCHGPGAEHVAVQRVGRRSGTAISDAEDSIVNPAKLSRDLQDAICAQCHLRGDATVTIRNRQAADFVPGEPLTNVRIDWFLSAADGRMKVTGHSDQMVASRCWQASESLTCVTCHDGHPATTDAATGTAAVVVKDYRSRCLQCHAEGACGEAAADRRATVPQDNCIACHMPQVATDIPHIAFTHHRIGLHGEQQKATYNAQTADLLPFGDVSAVTSVELQRSHALACAEFSSRAPSAELSAEFRRRAVRELASLVRTTTADGEVHAALARLLWEDGEVQTAEQQAVAALRDPYLSPGGRVNSLFVQGDSLLQRRRFAEAVSPLQQLTTLRRSSEDWLIRGLAEFQAGEQSIGLRSVEHAAAIQPFRRDIPETLRKLRAAAKQ